ncbi:hypothetical protein [Streptomyces mirabilis]|uniref:hypothetical protein n=1 Tax=Streptomyces mirabilis TaxID=68239 RepID=UPI00381091E9
MKMTETFAATIAVVAPVIWLVAAVEVHHHLKRFESLQTLGATTSRARAYAAEIEGPMTSEQARHLNKLMKEGDESFREEFEQPPINGKVSVAYLLIVVILTLAELFPLLWLSGPQKSNPGMALFCLIAVLLSFVGVFVLPAVKAFGIAAWVARDRERNLDWLSYFAKRQSTFVDRDSPEN